MFLKRDGNEPLNFKASKIVVGAVPTSQIMQSTTRVRNIKTIDKDGLVFLQKILRANMLMKIGLMKNQILMRWRKNTFPPENPVYPFSADLERV